MTESPLGRAPDAAAEPAQQAEPEVPARQDQLADREQLEQPSSPDESEHTEHTEHPEHAEHPDSEHTAHPEHAEHAEHPEHVDPEHPEHAGHADPEHTEHTEHPEHPESPGAPEPAPRPTTMAARSTLRRAPRFARFVGAGIALGAVLAALAAILGPPGTTLGRGAIFLLVFLALGSLGALLGSLLAVVADRRSVGRR